MTGLLYGCVVLHSYRGEASSTVSPVTFPFVHMDKIEIGNHFGEKVSDEEKPFDYFLGCIDAETSKLSAPSRGVTIGGMRVGDESEDNLTHKIIYNLLTINSTSTEEDKNLPYLDLVYAKISKNAKGRMFATFDILSSKSKFVIMSKGVPVYMFTFSDEHATYFMWSNEETLRQRMRDFYGNQFYYYDLGVLIDGTLVIQSYYVRKLYQKWRKNLRDRLMVMNALEEYINKKTLKDADIAL